MKSEPLIAEVNGLDAHTRATHQHPGHEGWAGYIPRGIYFEVDPFF